MRRRSSLDGMATLGAGFAGGALRPGAADGQPAATCGHSIVIASDRGYSPRFGVTG